MNSDIGRPSLGRLKKRSEFLRAARTGRKWATAGLVLQAVARPRAEREGAGDRQSEAAVRVGFTASRKVGNAVARNRAKRRLRAVSDAVLPRAGKPGTDYVLIARQGTLVRPYPGLLGDLEAALSRVETTAGGPRRRPVRPSGDSRTGPRGSAG